MKNNQNTHNCCKHKKSNHIANNYHINDDDTWFICPMHPEIRQQQFGDCPICGMALEQEILSLNDTIDKELVSLKRRFYIACVLSIPLAIFTMSLHFIPKLMDIIPNMLINLIQFSLSTPVVVWAGLPLLMRAITSIKQSNLNMYTLLGLGITTSYLYSVFIMIFPNSLATFNNHYQLYFETSAVITTFVLLGELLELTARHKAKYNMRSLLDLTPLTGRLVNNHGIEKKINIDEISKNDLLRVLAGDKIPVDGLIIEGHATVDQSMLTGETMPVIKNLGDKVIGGTLNIAGTFIMQVTAIAKHGMLAQIINMVLQAQRTKAPIQRIADLVAKYFVMIVITIAIITFISWYILSPTEYKLSYAIINAVTVLVVACPCALGLATPMSIMVAISKAAKLGILIKNAVTIETLSKINNIIIDKTGTITEGKPVFNQIITNDNLFTENEILQLVASLEKNSEHPLAATIIEEAVKRNILMLPVKNFQTTVGGGIQGIIDNNHLVVGNAKFINNQITNIVNSVDHGILKKMTEQAQTAGEIVVFVQINNKVVAFIAIIDPIKQGSVYTIEKLKKHNIQITMLTGDHLLTAKYVANQVNITNVVADALPIDKINMVKKLQQDTKIVAMIGDGINDAPALSQADISIAMGNGTDVAIESSDIILVKGDLRNVIRAYNLSKYTMRNIKQNLFFAFAYNIIGVPVATGMLYPIFGILLSPMIASITMALSSFLVIINALRINNLTLTELEQ